MWGLLLLGIAVAILASCRAEHAVLGPSPGPVTATIVGPTDADGAAIVDILGNVESVSATAARAFSTRLGDTTRVIIVRTDAGSLAFHFVLRDVAIPLSARIVEIAGADNVVRADASAYSVKFSNGAASP